MARQPDKGAVVVGSGGRLRVLFQYAGKSLSNVYHFTGTSGSPVTLAKVQTVSADLRSAFSTTGYQALAGGTFGIVGAEVTDISDTDNAPISSTAAPINGIAVGKLLPMEVALVVTLRTAKRGPLYRGRSYLMGFADAANTTDGQAGAEVTALGPLWLAAVQTALDAHQWTLGVLSRKYPADPEKNLPAKDATIDEVINFVVRDGFWDSQRRRGLG